MRYKTGLQMRVYHNGIKKISLEWITCLRYEKDFNFNRMLWRLLKKEQQLTIPTCPTLGAGVSRASGSCPRAYAVVASVRTKHLSGTDAARTRRKIRRQSVEGRRVPYHGHRHSQKEKTKNGPHFDLLARIYTVVVLNVFGFEHQIKQP